METNTQKILGMALVVLTLLSGSSCARNDDYSNLSDRVSRLESLCAQLQTNIESTVSLLEALSGNEFITEVIPLREGNRIIGYTITFSKSGPITLYNGNEGTAPDIAAKLDSDGIYYWAIGQEWVRDAQGNKIPVLGVTPQLKVEDGVWFVSMDGGNTWEQMEQTGNSVFIKSIEDQATSVIFVLSDGSRITMLKNGIIPVQDKYHIASPDNYYNLQFDLPDDEREYQVNAYIIGYDSDEQNLWYEPYTRFYVNAAICQKDNGPGKPRTKIINIYLETPQILPNHFEMHVDILMKDEGAFSIIQSVNLPFERLVTDNKMPELVFVSAGEQTVELGAMTNADETDVRGLWDYEWITYENTTGTRADLHQETQRLRFSANVERFPRMAKVTLCDMDYGNHAVIREFIVMQAGTDTYIEFADSEVERICLANYDKDSNGKISYEEAFFSGSSYFSDSPFTESSIVSFNELKYFGFLGNYYYLFKDCYLLESVELPEYTTFIINYDAFKNCSSLKKIEIPSSVTQIYDRAFFQCGIETIMIPRSVKAFGSRCFYSCLNLSAVYLEKEYDSYGNRKELIVDSIPESMFEGCSNLRKIDGAISTKEIEEKAFKDTDLSEQETSIHTRRYGDFAFYGTNLKEIALDAEYIGAHAFENCNQLEKVRTGYGATASLKDLPFLGADAFKREGEPIDTLIIWSESMYYKFVDQGWTKYFKQVALQEWGNITVIIGDGWSAS